MQFDLALTSHPLNEKTSDKSEVFPWCRIVEGVRTVFRNISGSAHVGTTLPSILLSHRIKICKIAAKAISAQIVFSTPG